MMVNISKDQNKLHAA